MTLVNPSSPITASFTIATNGEVVTVTDTSTASDGTVIDAVSFTWSDGPATECPPGGSVSHTYPNGSQRKIVQTVTGATTVVATSQQVVYPKYTPPVVAPPVAVSPPPPPPPVSPPPPPPAATDGRAPPTNGILANDGTVIPYPLVDSGPGAAEIIATLADGSVWKASANASGDCTAPCQHVFLADAKGNAHPYLIADFYGDGVVLCNDLVDSPANIVLSFAVSFNGKTIYRSLQKTLYTRTGFWPIRWSVCGYKPIDLALCPNWGTDAVPNIIDWQSGQLGIDQRGMAQYNGMGSPGERADLGIVHGFGVTFAQRPCDAAYITLRIMEDSERVWPWHARDRATLEPIFVPDYPNATLLTFTPPIGPIGPPDKGCPYVPNGAHQTHYGAGGYMASGSTFDRDSVVTNANYGIIWQNPMYRGETGDQGLSLLHSAPRMKAWALAGYFWAAKLLPQGDKFQAYFDKVSRDNAGAFALAYLGDTSRFTGLTYPNAKPILPGSMVTPMNVFADGGAYGEAPANGGATYPGWMDDYFCGVVDWAVEKLGFDYWKSVRDWKAGFRMHCVNEAPYEFATAYTTLVAPVAAGPNVPPVSWCANMTEAFAQQWPWAVGIASGSQAMFDAINTEIAGGAKGIGGKLLAVGDMLDSSGKSPSGYPAIARQAFAAAVNAVLPGAAAAWKTITSTPTGINWTGTKYNIVPRAA